MKLFVWNDPYQVSWGKSCVFALGETVEEARQAAKVSPIWPYGIGEPSGQMVGDADLDREPDLILESGAVCYEWSE